MRLPFLLILASCNAPAHLHDEFPTERDELVVDGQLAAPTTGGITLTVPTPLQLGQTATLTVEHTYPGETVYLIRSLNGIGPGPCFRPIGGGCLDISGPIAIIGRVPSDASGTAVFELRPTPRHQAADIALQAVVIHGYEGVDSVLSNAVAVAVVDPDSDLDGVPDSLDPCPLDNPDDSDGDGVCDTDDQCPGGDDAVDLDGSGQPDACEGTSCQEIKLSNPAASTGVYTVDPDGPGGDAPFAVYCDMTTDGGGWTLVQKLLDHAAIDYADDPLLRGDARLLSETFDASTPGSIHEALPYGEMLFKHDDTTWVRVSEPASSWHQHGNNSCRDLTSVAHLCSGLDCSTKRHLVWRRVVGTGTTSGFLLGATAGSSSGQCGDTWCSSNKHGRYNGVCDNASRGLGDWLTFVR